LTFSLQVILVPQSKQVEAKKERDDEAKRAAIVGAVS